MCKAGASPVVLNARTVVNSFDSRWDEHIVTVSLFSHLSLLVHYWCSLRILVSSGAF